MANELKEFCGEDCARLYAVQKNRDELHARCLSLENEADSARAENEKLRAQLARVVEAGKKIHKRYVEITVSCCDGFEASACDECEEYNNCDDAKFIAEWDAAIKDAAVKEVKL